MKKKILTIFSAVFVLVLILTPLFIKIKVECKSQYGECPTDINSKLQALNSKSLFQSKIESQKLLKSEFLISDFSTQFQLPNILKVNLLIKKPAFAISDSGSGNIGLVDQNGQILSISKNNSLPFVVTSKNLVVGGSVSSKELFALKIVQGIFEMYQTGRGDIMDDSLVVALPGQIKVIFPLSGDVQVLLGEARLTYGKVESGDLAGKYSEIDLRFRNPVLR